MGTLPIKFADFCKGGFTVSGQLLDIAEIRTVQTPFDWLIAKLGTVVCRAGVSLFLPRLRT